MKGESVCCGWEDTATNDGLFDGEDFYKVQRNGLELNQTCRCLDVRNIIVSPHLISDQWPSCPSVGPRRVGRGSGGEGEGTERRRLLPALDTSSLSCPPPERPPGRRPSLPRCGRLARISADCAQAPSGTSRDFTPPNFAPRPKHESADVSSGERTLPLIHWSPSSSWLQSEEDDDQVPWRCRALGSRATQTRQVGTGDAEQQNRGMDTE